MEREATGTMDPTVCRLTVEASLRGFTVNPKVPSRVEFTATGPVTLFNKKFPPKRTDPSRVIPPEELTVSPKGRLDPIAPKKERSEVPRVIVKAPPNLSTVPANWTFPAREVIEVAPEPNVTALLKVTPPALPTVRSSGWLPPRAPEKVTSAVPAFTARLAAPSSVELKVTVPSVALPASVAIVVSTRVKAGPLTATLPPKVLMTPPFKMTSVFAVRLIAPPS